MASGKRSIYAAIVGHFFISVEAEALARRAAGRRAEAQMHGPAG